ncbi:hypothetical protein ZWY2020_037109 [Hordeum vulgare]|nr:hypothetical protein ZWY2020_037109 [Hordeum vulgare]
MVASIPHAHRKQAGKVLRPRAGASARLPDAGVRNSGSPLGHGTKLKGSHHGSAATLAALELASPPVTSPSASCSSA